MSDIVFKIAPISDHVAKFRGDRPRDRGDLALNKKEEKKKQQQNIRPAFALWRNGRTYKANISIYYYLSLSTESKTRDYLLLGQLILSVVYVKLT